MRPTYGENRVRTLLESLSNRKHFFWRAEPRLAHQRTAHLQPDFIVVGAYLGVVVLEIKDWVAIREATQDRVIIRRRDGTEMQQENPVRVAQDYAYALMDMFQKRAELLHQNGRYRGRLTFPVGYAVVLPNLPQAIIQQGIEHNIWREGEVIGPEQLRTPEAFEQALTDVRMPFPLQGSITPLALDVIRGVIDPKLVVKDSADRESGTLSPLQERLINELPRNFPPQRLPLTADGVPVDLADVIAASLQPELDVRLIRGVAGSGKTLVLVKRARTLMEAYEGKRILVVTFNRSLAEMLKKQIQPTDHCEVLDFHQLCFQITGWITYRSESEVVGWLSRHEWQALRALNLSAEFVAAEIAYRKDMSLWDGDAYLQVERKGRERPLGREARQIINGIFERYRAYQRERDFWDWSDAPHFALEKLREGHALSHAFAAALIDEAQDFAPSWIAVIKELLQAGGQLFMCEDPSQSIFRLHSWQERGVSVVGRTHVLAVPYRTTRAISEAAHRLIANDPFVQERVSPDLRTYFLSEGDPPQLVQCDSPQEELEHVCGVVEELLEQGIPAEQIAILLPQKRFEASHQGLSRGVRLLTFYTMKGLEFRAVILPHLDQLFQDLADEAAVSKSKRLLFTAMTRAREQLYLSFVGALPEPLKALGLTPERPSPRAAAQNAG